LPKFAHLNEVKNMKKILSAAALSAALILAASPADAATNSNPLSGITDWLESAKQSVEKYTKTLTEKVAGLGKEFEQIAQNATGDLGLIDPAKARSNAEKVVNPDSATYKSGVVANEIERQSARASVNSILSQDGQTQQAGAYQATQNSVNAVGQQSETAQGDNITQNVMKRIAQQNAETSQVLGGVRSDLLKMNEQAAQTNVQLSNVSRTLDGQTAAKNAEQVGVGYSNLKTASQAGLF
jgi:opacity protein-like surface antigen